MWLWWSFPKMIQQSGHYGSSRLLLYENTVLAKKFKNKVEKRKKKWDKKNSWLVYMDNYAWGYPSKVKNIGNTYHFSKFWLLFYSQYFHACLEEKVNEKSVAFLGGPSSWAQVKEKNWIKKWFLLLEESPLPTKPHVNWIYFISGVMCVS
jgi:hypothetical protein